MDRDIFMGGTSPETDHLRDPKLTRPMPADTPLTRPLDRERAASDQRDHDITDQTALGGVAHAAITRGPSSPPPPSRAVTSEITRIAPRRPRIVRPPIMPSPVPERGDKASRVEARRTPPMVIIDKTPEVTKKDTAATANLEKPSGPRPEENNITMAIRAGRHLRQIFSWINGEVTLEATPDMVPLGSKVRERGPVVPGSETNPGLHEGFTWTRLRGVFTATKALDAIKIGDKVGGARRQDVVNQCKDVDFAAALVGDPIRPKQHEELIWQAGTNFDDKTKSGLDPEAEGQKITHGIEKMVYSEAMSSGLVDQTVVIGTANPEDLERTAEAVAAAFTSRRPLLLEPVRDETDNIQTFSSLEEALQPNSDSIIVTAAEFADHAELPDMSMPGLGRAEAPTNFDADHEIPEGVPRVTFAKIVDNFGNLTKKALSMTREHVVIFAESLAGKSVLLRVIGVDIQRQNFERRLAAEAAREAEWDHEALVYIDCKNEGEFAHDFSRQIGGVESASGENMPEDMATVHRILAGGDGPGVRFNLLRPVGDAPKDWRKRLDTAIEVMTSKYRAMEPDTYRFMKKYLGLAIDRAISIYGRDPVTGRAIYTHGADSTPTGEFTASCVDEVVRDQVELKGEHLSNAVGWLKSEVNSLFRGNNGAMLAATAYRFDPLAALRNKGVTSIDMANIRDAGARQVATLAALYDLYDGCVELNRQQTGRDMTDKIRCTVVVDEADVFGNDALGEVLADFLTHARHVGLRFVLAKQGVIKESMNKHVLVNAPNKIMLRSSHEPDIEAYANDAGKTTINDMRHISGVPDGMGVYKGPRMPRGIRFQVPNPHKAKLGDRSYVVGPEALIDLEGDLEAFSQEEKAVSERFLATDPLGREISNWAELNAIKIASGRRMDKLDNELAEVLKAWMQHPDASHARQLRCHVTSAAKNSLNTRPDLQWVSPLRAYKRHLIPNMLAMANGEPLPDWDKPQPEIALNVGKYNKAYNPDADATDDNAWKRYEVIIDGRFGAAKDRLKQQMTATPHPETERYEQVLGEPLLGVTAYEQQDVVVRSGIDAADRVGRVAEDIVGGRRLLPDTLTKTAYDIQKLVGGEAYKAGVGAESVEQQEALIRVRATEIVQSAIVKQRGYEMDAKEETALAGLVRRMTVADLASTEGYPAVQAALKEWIESHKQAAGPVDPDELEELCGYRVVADKALDQLRIIERQWEQDVMVTVPYVDRVELNDIFFAHDPLRPGSTLDNNVALAQAQERAGGLINRLQRTKAGKPAAADYTLGMQLAQGDYSGWRDALSWHVLYSPYFHRSDAETRYLLERFGAITAQLNEDAKSDKQAAAKGS